MDRLRDKLALVTGGGAGIGAQIARRFREEGATLIINDVRAEEAQKVADEVGGTAIAADVSDSAAVARMFEQVDADFGRLDVLVNNAGIAFDGDPALLEQYDQVPFKQMAERAQTGRVETHADMTVDLSDEDWHRMIGVHLNGTFFCKREALKSMGPQLSGCIVNMGSIMGTTGGVGSSYCAAKAGILGFPRSVAREVVTRNIRVNAIAPGFIETDMTAVIGNVRELIKAGTPMHRFGEPDDIAWAAVYLASEEAKFVTGQVLSPNGGLVMSQ